MKPFTLLLGLCIFISSVTSLPQLSSRRKLSQGNETTEDVEDIAEHTLTLIAKGQSEIPLEDNYKDVVLLIGNIGAQKTTIAKFLSGVELQSVETGPGRFVIKDQSKPNASSPGSNKVFPELYINNSTDTAFYNLPSFSDTRNASVEIANGLFMKIVADHVENIKLIFVVPYLTLKNKENRANFHTLFEHATNFIKRPQKFKNAIGLIVTKVEPAVEDGIILEEVVAFLKTELEALKDRFEDEVKQKQVEEIIGAFLTQDENQRYGRIGLFKTPTKSGLLSEMEYFKEASSKLKSLIEEQLKFVKDDPEDFGLTISKRVHKYINVIADKVRSGFKSGLDKLADSIGNHYEQMINSHALEAVVGTVAKDTIVIDTMTQTLENSTTRQDFIEILIQGLVQISLPSNDFLTGILFQQSNLEFIEIIEGNETFPLIQEWTSPLKEMLGFLREEMSKMLQMLNSRMDEEIQMVIQKLEPIYFQEENEGFRDTDLLIFQEMLKQLENKTSFNELLHLISNNINNLSVNASFPTDNLELEEDIEIPSFPQLQKEAWLRKFHELVEKLVRMDESATEITNNVLDDFETTLGPLLEDNELHEFSDNEKSEVREVRAQISNLTSQVSGLAEEIKMTESQKKDFEHKILEFNKSLQELHKKKANLRQMLFLLKHKLEGNGGHVVHEIIDSAEDLPVITTDYGVCASACKNFTYSYNWCYLKKFRYNDYYWDYCTPPKKAVLTSVNFSAHGLPCKSECKLEDDVYKCSTDRFGIGSKFEKSDYCSPQVSYDYKNRKCKGNCFEASTTKVCYLETGKRSLCSF